MSKEIGKTRAENIDMLCEDLMEMVSRASADLCGEQRDFYMPRIVESFACAGNLFPAQMARALDKAKSNVKP